MSISVLIDHFHADPEALYRLITEKVMTYGIPDVGCNRIHEERGRKLFKGAAEEVSTLEIHNGIHSVRVLGYQYGNNFFVSTRRDFKSFAEAQRIATQRENGTYPYLDEIRAGCFAELVERAVHEALEEFRQHHEPPDVPEPQDVFTTA